MHHYRYLPFRFHCSPSPYSPRARESHTFIKPPMTILDVFWASSPFLVNTWDNQSSPFIESVSLEKSPSANALQTATHQQRSGTDCRRLTVASYLFCRITSPYQPSKQSKHALHKIRTCNCPRRYYHGRKRRISPWSSSPKHSRPNPLSRCSLQQEVARLFQLQRCQVIQRRSLCLVSSQEE